MELPKDLNTYFSKDLKGPLPRILLYNDLSGFGKCSLTVSLPIFAAAGIEGVCLPTAVLSTHTGEFKDVYSKDLTASIEPILKRWHQLKIPFEGIYSGYLASFEQAELLLNFLDLEENKKIRYFCDPVMGDNGKLYSKISSKMIEAMSLLSKRANFLFPNLTEACALIGKNYPRAILNKEEINEILFSLSKLGPNYIVLTGIPTKEKIRIASFDHGKIDYFYYPKLNGIFHGAGDIFASFLIASYINGLNFNESTQLAGFLVFGALKRTEIRGTPRRDGIDFEGILPEFISRLNVLKNSMC